MITIAGPPRAALQDKGQVSKTPQQYCTDPEIYKSMVDFKACKQVEKSGLVLQLARSLYDFFMPPRSFLKSEEVFYGKVAELRLFLRKLARAKSRTGHQVPIRACILCSKQNSGIFHDAPQSFALC